MKKIFTMVLVLILIIISTTGCLHIFLAEDLLVPKIDKPIVYEFKSYHFADNFTSNFPVEVLQIYEEEFPIEIKPETENMRIDISVFMRSADEVIEIINNTPGEGTVKEILMELLEQALELSDQRYIEIRVKLPDGYELYNGRFNQTNQVDVPLISSPSEGTWIVEVEGAGIGGGDGDLGFEYHDSFSVDVIVKEIKE
jgi:hypothetical protein